MDLVCQGVVSSMRPRTKSKEPSEVSRAVVALRTALGQTQQQFAQTLGTAITTIARYETDRSPRSNALAKLFSVAHHHKLDDLKRTFAKALAADIGVQEAFLNFDLDEDQLLTVRVHTAQELADCNALIHAYGDSEFFVVGREIRKLLEPVKKALAKENQWLTSMITFATGEDFTPSQIEEIRAALRQMSAGALSRFALQVNRAASQGEAGESQALIRNLTLQRDEAAKEWSRRKEIAPTNPVEKSDK